MRMHWEFLSAEDGMSDPASSRSDMVRMVGEIAGEGQGRQASHNRGTAYRGERVKHRWAPARLELEFNMERNPMKYIEHGKGGDVDCMTLADGPAPTPGPGQILIEVACAGVNRPDVLQRSGKYPPPPDASPVLGLEVAGTVAALGDGVTDWKVGAGVTALTPGGGYAEYCVTPAAHALPIPAGMDFATAAALPETWFTVWANLVDLGRLKRGERLLVHGGSSGIGLVAIQLAKHLGAECIVTVGNEEKAAFCRTAGAAHAINYRTADFGDEVKRITGGEGVDVMLDMVGAPYLQRNLASAAPRRAAGLCGLPGRQQRRRRPDAGDDQTPDDHRLDHAPAHRDREGRDPRCVGREHLAGAGAWRTIASSFCTLPAWLMWQRHTG
jgi:putative PIG3 family NAD(P)H quinone oxidoreductase